jgi:glycosyltransferase involved in cell wall biosynthesis
MKILLVTEYFPPKIFGGGEISTEILAKTLSNEGFDIHVLTSGQKGLNKYQEKNKIHIHRLLKTGSNPSSIIENFKRLFFFQKSIKKEIKKLDKQEKFDIIHFLNTTSIPTFKLKTNAKKIATYNSYTNFCPKRNLFYKDKKTCSGPKYFKCMACLAHSDYVGKAKMPFYLKYNPIFWTYLYQNYKSHNKGLQNIDKHIAISEYLNDLLQKNKIKKLNISILPNLAKLTESNESFEIKEKGFIISYAGALEKIKGIDLLIKSIVQLNDPEIKLLIFGEGSQLEELKKISNNNIIFYGKVDHKYIGSIYSKSDLIVLPTLWPEPLARNLLEATYYGKPIIASDTGGTKDSIINGVNGFLIEPKISELKEKIIILKNNKELCKKMGEESKKIYNEKFNNKKVLKRIIEVYKDGK